MDNIKIGQIVNVVGLKGEVKVYNYSDYKERFEELDYIYIDGKKIEIENVRYAKNLVVLKIKGINNRNEAEKLKNKFVFIDESQLRELPEDTFYIKDLVGLDVVDENENKIGILKDILQSTAQDLYVIIREDEKEILLPSVKEFVLDIDLESKRILVKLPDGLLDI